MNELKEISDKEEQMSRLKDILELTQEDYDERSKIAQYIQVKLLSTHCSKSSFFVQKFNFDFPRKLSIFLGEKLAKMLWFWAF